MAKASTSTPNSPKFDFSRLVSHTEIAEGGGGFGPSSFRGTIIDAGYRIHRFLSDPPKPDQNTAYFLILWAKFHVDEVLDQESGWDPDDHDNIYEHTSWKLGGKSLQHLFATNDTTSPAGISGGFEELQLLAQGQANGRIIGFDGDIAATTGRWFMVQPGIPENKGKLEGKSGYGIMLRESVPAIEAVDPSLILTFNNKKGEEEKTLNVYMNDADGYPMGARFFIGLSGIWDTKKISLSIKDKGTGATSNVDQKVLYLTSFDGRVEVGQEGQIVQQRKAGSGSTKAASAAGKAASSKPATTTTAATTAPSTSSDETLDEKINRLILASLPESGEVTKQDLGIAVVRDSHEFSQGEMMQAMTAYRSAVESAPNKEDAASLAEMGMPPFYTYNQATAKVERFTTA